jgi:hypothetical protein
MVEATWRSACEREVFTAIALPLFLIDLLQLPLDCAGAAEQTSVHFFEAIVRCVEHEATRHANGNADGAPIEFDRETLIGHYSSPGVQERWRRHNGPPDCSPNRMKTLRTLMRCAARWESPERGRKRRYQLRALESCGAATWMQPGPVEGRMLGHNSDMGALWP